MRKGRLIAVIFSLILAFGVFATAACGDPVADETVTGVTVSPTTLTLTLGGTETGKLNATVNGTASDKSVTWAVHSGGDFVEVDSQGNVTAKAAGTATVRATSNFDNTKFGASTVTVNPAQSTDPVVTAVTIAPATVTLVTGGTQQLTATVSVTPDTADNKAVTWSVVSGATATGLTVSTSGLVTAGSVVGTATVRATSDIDNTKYADLVITVNPPADTVTGISIKEEPSKTEYKIGETVSLAGLELTATLFGGDTATIVYADGNITHNQVAFTQADVGDVEVTVTYLTFTATFTVEVIDVTFESIEITAQPTTDSYARGEFFDPAGLVVEAQFDDSGFNYDIPHADLSFTWENTDNVPNDSLRLMADEGSLIITVSYQGEEATFTITVTAAEIVDFIIGGDFRTEYNAGNDFNMAGLTVTAVYSDDTEEVVADNIGVSLNAPSPLLATHTYVTVSYEGIDKQIPITVGPVALEGITLTQVPTKTDYTAGDLFSIEGLIVTANYSDRDEPVLLSQLAFFDPYNEPLIPGVTTMTSNMQGNVTVKFGEFSEEYPITVRSLVSIEIVTPPNLANVVDGLFMPNSLQIELTFDNGETATIFYTDTTFNGVFSFLLDGEAFDLNTPLTLDHNGLEVGVQYTLDGVTRQAFLYDDEALVLVVTDSGLAEIEIDTEPTKLSYALGEYLDASGIVVLGTDGDGNPYENNPIDNVAFLHFSFDGVGVGVPAASLRFMEEGVITVYVHYVGKTDTFEVTVGAATLTSISVFTQPTKLVYDEGDVFDAAGLVIRAVYTNETVYIAYDSDIDVGITFSDAPLTQGSGQAFVINFEGLTATVTINVGPVVLRSLEIRVEPKVHYIAGEAFSLAGIEVFAHYSNSPFGGTEITDMAALIFTVNGITLSNGLVLTADHSGTVTVAYTFGATTQYADFAITVQTFDGFALADEDFAFDEYKVGTTFLTTSYEDVEFMVTLSDGDVAGFDDPISIENPSVGSFSFSLIKGDFVDNQTGADFSANLLNSVFTEDGAYTLRVGYTLFGTTHYIYLLVNVSHVAPESIEVLNPTRELGANSVHNNQYDLFDRITFGGAYTQEKEDLVDAIVWQILDAGTFRNLVETDGVFIFGNKATITANEAGVYELRATMPNVIDFDEVEQEFTVTVYWAITDIEIRNGDVDTNGAFAFIEPDFSGVETLSLFAFSEVSSQLADLDKYTFAWEIVGGGTSIELGSATDLTTVEIIAKANGATTVRLTVTYTGYFTGVNNDEPVVFVAEVEVTVSDIQAPATDADTSGDASIMVTGPDATLSVTPNGKIDSVSWEITVGLDDIISAVGDNDGLTFTVSAVSAGEATVTVTIVPMGFTPGDDDIVKTFTVTVAPGPATEAGSSISDTALNLTIGGIESATLTLDLDGGAAVEWSVVGDAVSVPDISTGTSVLVTAEQGGTATVIATVTPATPEGPGTPFTLECEVNVIVLQRLPIGRPVINEAFANATGFDQIQITDDLVVSATYGTVNAQGLAGNNYLDGATSAMFLKLFFDTEQADGGYGSIEGTVRPLWQYVWRFYCVETDELAGTITTGQVWGGTGGLPSASAIEAAVQSYMFDKDITDPVTVNASVQMAFRVPANPLNVTLTHEGETVTLNVKDYLADSLESARSVRTRTVAPAQTVNNWEELRAAMQAGGNVYLGSDIDASDSATFVGGADAWTGTATTLNGEFNGGGHTISNLHVNGRGIYNNMGNNAAFKHVTFADPVFTPSAETYGFLSAEVGSSRVFVEDVHIQDMKLTSAFANGGGFFGNITGDNMWMTVENSSITSKDEFVITNHFGGFANFMGRGYLEVDTFTADVSISSVAARVAGFLSSAITVEYGRLVLDNLDITTTFVDAGNGDSHGVLVGTVEHPNASQTMHPSGLPGGVYLTNSTIVGTYSEDSNGFHQGTFGGIYHRAFVRILNCDITITWTGGAAPRKGGIVGFMAYGDPAPDNVGLEIGDSTLVANFSATQNNDNVGIIVGQLDSPRIARSLNDEAYNIANYTYTGTNFSPVPFKFTEWVGM